MPNDADVLIVGSGPLGAAAARRLAEHGRSVLILEQGPAITDPVASHARKQPRFQTDPDSYLETAIQQLAFFDENAPRDSLPGAAVTSVQGGQGVIWTNLCPRGDAPWAALSAAEWDQYYDMAESYLAVQGDWFDGSKRQHTIGEALHPAMASEGRQIETLPVAATPDENDHLYFTAPYDILAALPKTKERVRIASGTVDSLLHDRKRVTGVKVGDETITAKEVIIAAGAIGTPQLLHRSGIRPKALGRWLSYHPILICQIVLKEDLCVAPGETDREPRLQIRPTDDADWYTIILRDVSPFEPGGNDVDIDSSRLVELQIICPVDLDEKNGIRFDEESHPSFSLPLSAADEKRLTSAEAEAKRFTDLLGRYRTGCEPIWMPFGFAHMTGTTRMSETEDGTGVTDYNGRVWGFDNLHLATNGLIPTRMAVNPTLTGVALSLHVADKIGTK